MQRQSQWQHQSVVAAGAVVVVVVVVGVALVVSAAGAAVVVVVVVVVLYWQYQEYNWQCHEYRLLPRVLAPVAVVHFAVVATLVLVVGCLTSAVSVHHDLPRTIGQL